MVLLRVLMVLLSLMPAMSSYFGHLIICRHSAQLHKYAELNVKNDETVQNMRFLDDVATRSVFSFTLFK